MNKKQMSEQDIRSKFITPAIVKNGWDQIREEVTFSKGRIIVRGKRVSRGKAKRADYILTARLSMATSRDIIVPIPPQKKCIVAKVDELITLCDGLEMGLSQSQTDSNRLRKPRWQRPPVSPEYLQASNELT